MSPETMRTMAGHTAYLCLIAELSKAGLIDIASLADQIEAIGERHGRENKQYGDLIVEIGRSVRSVDPLAPPRPG
ncbi:hypothetical protein T8J41_13980 [Nitratireductor rhodophyticola]|uniref:hypothetical protein n=1 Tax=Nitratireductor rhodophyticola TaxID=2854036 RepID=UPI002AC957F1|nr:hypothetical protein [Nitratireductor rhodophyticola]WPZ13265.1 hypothetical protein T8J41_13980 [Nitratireductor rhodophyticola]